MATRDKARTGSKRSSVKKGRAVTVEVPREDGSTALFVGREVSRTADRIVLADAAWVADTGRRHEFMAGTLAGTCEIEPYAGEVELPLAGAWIAAWPGELPLVAR